MGEQWEGVRQGAPTRTSQFTTIEILPQTELSPYLPDLIIISFSQESLQWSTVPVPCRWEFLEKNVQKKKKMEFPCQEAAFTSQTAPSPASFSPSPSWLCVSFAFQSLDATGLPAHLPLDTDFKPPLLLPLIPISQASCPDRQHVLEKEGKVFELKPLEVSKKLEQ